MAEAKLSTDEGWSPVVEYGRLVLLPLMILYTWILRPVADAWLVLWVYGLEGWERGLQVVWLNRAAYFSDGADIPSRVHFWTTMGYLIAIPVAAWLTLYLVRCVVARLPERIAPDLRRQFDKVVFFRRQPPRPRPMSTREFVLFVGGTLGVCGLMLIGPHLWWSCDLALHEQRTRGVVVREVTRGSLIYRYSVAGRDYAGSTNTRSLRPHPAGSPVEVRYSSNNPAHGTIGDPLRLAKQFLFAAVMMACVGTVGFVAQKRKDADARDPER